MSGTVWPSGPHLRLTSAHGHVTILSQDGVFAEVRIKTPSYPYTHLFNISLHNAGGATITNAPFWDNQYGGLFQGWNNILGITREVTSADWGTYQNRVWQQISTGETLSLAVTITMADTATGPVPAPVAPTYPRNTVLFEDFLPMTGAGALWHTFGNPTDDGNSSLVLLGNQTAMMPPHPQGLNTAQYGVGNGLFEFKAKFLGGRGSGTGPALVLWPADDVWPSVSETILGEIDLGEFWLTQNAAGFHEMYMALHWKNAAGQNADQLYNIIEQGKATQEHDPTQWNIYGARLQNTGVRLYINGRQIVHYTARGAPDWANGGVNHTLGILNASSETTCTIDWVRWTPDNLVGAQGTTPYSLPIPPPSLPPPPPPPPPPPGAPPANEPAAPTGWTEVFYDDFPGTTLDRAKWAILYGGGKSYPNDATWSHAGIVVNNGLTIRVWNDGGAWFTGGIQQGNVNSSPTHFGYGDLQVSIKARVQAGSGIGSYALLWPASDQWVDEFDIFETPGATKQSVMVTYHWPPNMSPGSSATYAVDMTQDHVYTVRRTNGVWRYWIDGVEKTVPADWATDPSTEPMVVGLAGFLAHPDAYGWYGTVSGATPSLHETRVTYVRVHANTGGTTPPPPAPAENPPNVPGPPQNAIRSGAATPIVTRGGIPLLSSPPNQAPAIVTPPSGLLWNYATAEGGQKLQWPLTMNQFDNIALGRNWASTLSGTTERYGGVRYYYAWTHVNWGAFPAWQPAARWVTRAQRKGSTGINAQTLVLTCSHNTLAIPTGDTVWFYLNSDSGEGLTDAATTYALGGGFNLPLKAKLTVSASTGSTDQPVTSTSTVEIVFPSALPAIDHTVPLAAWSGAEPKLVLMHHSFYANAATRQLRYPYDWHFSILKDQVVANGGHVVLGGLQGIPTWRCWTHQFNWIDPTLMQELYAMEHQALAFEFGATDPRLVCVELENESVYPWLGYEPGDITLRDSLKNILAPLARNAWGASRTLVMKGGSFGSLDGLAYEFDLSVAELPIGNWMLGNHNYADNAPHKGTVSGPQYFYLDSADCALHAQTLLDKANQYGYAGAVMTEYGAPNNWAVSDRGTALGKLHTALANRSIPVVLWDLVGDRYGCAWMYTDVPGKIGVTVQALLPELRPYAGRAGRSV